MTASQRGSVRLCAAVMLASCTMSTAPKRDFDSAYRLWRSSGLVNYTFKSTVLCFCGPEYTAPMTVTVRGGAVISVVDRSTGAVRPLNYRQSVDSVFSAAATEIMVRPDRLHVTYDVSLGYPRTLTYGTPENDGGGYISVDSVRAVP